MSRFSLLELESRVMRSIQAVRMRDRAGPTRILYREKYEKKTGKLGDEQPGRGRKNRLSDEVGIYAGHGLNRGGFDFIVYDCSSGLA